MIKGNTRIVICYLCGFRILEDGSLRSRFEGEGKDCPKCGRGIKIISRMQAPAPEVELNMN